MEDNQIFMNLMTDFAFKRLFGSPKRKKLLIRFLNIIFAKDNLTVTDVTFHDKEILPADENGKRIVYDIYCTTPDEKQHIILEMQKLYHSLFENRTVYYACTGIGLQGEKGWNYNLKPVYSIFVVDFHFPHMTRKDLHDVRLMDIHSHEIYSDAMRMIFIHLVESKEKWEDCETDYDKLLFLIKNMHTMDKESKAYRSGEFEELFNESEICNMAAEDVVAYGQSYQKYVDTLDAVDTASRTSYTKGMDIGFEKGVEKGIEKGIEKERANSIRIMHAMGIPVEAIASQYGMTITSVSDILNN